MALLCVAILYGSNYNIAKIVTPEFVHPYGLVMIRVWIATALFWIFGRFAPKEKIAVSDYKRFIMCAIFGTAGTQMLYLKGLSMTSAINASVIMTLIPVSVLLLSVFLGFERLNKLKWAGIIVGIIGAFFLVGGNGFQFSGENTTGDLIILANTLCFALYLVSVKPLMLKYQSFTVIKWIFLIGCPLVIPFGIGEVLNTEFSTFPFHVWVALVYIIIGATFLVYLLNTYALGKLNPSVVGFYIYLQPIVSTSIAVSFGMDKLTIEKIVFSLLIFLGAFLVSRK
ncbi:DMT family transporter [Flexithrix dorotheae]|uniref:DMT family transporter n=1 Tax=Flexithrix dorotheae TaxID=70993 RepID=UPI00247FD799|nr:DMT family transporter [Flexithrix dorotheae]